MTKTRDISMLAVVVVSVKVQSTRDVLLASTMMSVVARPRMNSALANVKVEVHSMAISALALHHQFAVQNRDLKMNFEDFIENYVNFYFC